MTTYFGSFIESIIKGDCIFSDLVQNNTLGYRSEMLGCYPGMSDEAEVILVNMAGE